MNLPIHCERPELIRRGQGTAVYRVLRDGRPAILKCFDEENAVELQAYRLLAERGVPVLPVIEMASGAILLGDLAESEEWRLASAEDVESEPTGRAVARWYRCLHDVGRAFSPVLPARRVS